MPAKLCEISGVYLRERFRRDDFVIAEIRLADESKKRLAVKGNAESEEIVQGIEYRFYGRHETHPKYGPSFAFQTFILAEPHERGGVIRYLQLAPHIGAATASKLWNKFHSQAVRVLRETPDIAAAAIDGKRFSCEHAQEAGAKLQHLAALESVTIDLMNLLSGRGFPKATAKTVVKKWGNRAAKMLERNPYLLMMFSGCGFLRTDAMYCDLGHNPAKLKRQSLCAWHSLSSDMQGHTWHPVAAIVEGLRGKIGGARVDPMRACKLACRSGLLAHRRDAAGELWFAEGRKAKQEAYVAEKIAEAVQEKHEWPTIKGTAENDGRPSLHQAGEYVKVAAGGAIGILGGSPGTGKSYLTACVIKEALGTYGNDEILVCAPTGKAATRLAELMKQHGVDLAARTIHSMLGVESVDGGNWTFKHNELNTLPARLIVVDECSMLGVGLFASLLAARPQGCKLLLVGDTNQLPPVEHGAPLRDLIAVGVPYGELREIHRNAGSIVRVCANIRDSAEWQPDDNIDLAGHPPRNLKLLPGGTDTIVRLLQKIRDAGLADPIWECQVIVAVNKKSPLARQKLNEVLQAELNPNPAVDGSIFRWGDKVIQLKNQFVLNAKTGSDEPGKLLVCNGEQGRVVEVDGKKTVVQFANPDRLVRVYGSAKQEEGGSGDSSNNGGSNLDLAFCITSHKSQGSEWPVVIVCLDEYPGARMVCDRHWLYTSISRAKQICFLVGKLGTAYGMCRRQSLGKRKTFLRELIGGGLDGP